MKFILSINHRHYTPVIPNRVAAEHKGAVSKSQMLKFLDLYTYETS